MKFTVTRSKCSVSLFIAYSTGGTYCNPPARTFIAYCTGSASGNPYARTCMKGWGMTCTWITLLLYIFLYVSLTNRHRVLIVFVAYWLVMSVNDIHLNLLNLGLIVLLSKLTLTLLLSWCFTCMYILDFILAIQFHDVLSINIEKCGLVWWYGV